MPHLARSACLALLLLLVPLAAPAASSATAGLPTSRTTGAWAMTLTAENPLAGPRPAGEPLTLARPPSVRLHVPLAGAPLFRSASAHASDRPAMQPHPDSGTAGSSTPVATAPGSLPAKSVSAPAPSASTSASPLAPLEPAPATSSTSPALSGAPSSAPDAGAGPYALGFSWTRDGILTGSFAALWLSTEAIFKHSLSPSTCRWCDGDSLNALDTWGRGLRAGPGERTMDTLSNVVDFGMLPLAVLGTQAWLAYDDGASAWITEDALMVVEATVLALTVNQAVKFAAGRERPFVRDLSPEVRQSLRDPADNNLSFFSGHASFAFAVATAAGTVSHLRGYENSWAVWAVGLPIATAVPLLRMAADRHYLTDVLTGSLVGAAFGAAVPLLLHPRLSEANLRLGAGPQSVSVSGSF